MNVRQELEELNESLTQMIEEVRRNWDEQQRMLNPTQYLIPAELARTTDGKPLLADLLVARANVLITLATMPKEM